LDKRGGYAAAAAHDRAGRSGTHGENVSAGAAELMLGKRGAPTWMPLAPWRRSGDAGAASQRV
jgi:hypothetical protein